MYKNRIPSSILVMATDGLWDVMTNADVFEFAKELVQNPEKEMSSVAQKLVRNLVIAARGHQTPDGYWEKKNGDLASGDDISCLAVPIAKIKEFLE